MAREPLPEDFEPSESAPGESDDLRLELQAGARALLDAGGALSRVEPGYETRSQQLAMADAVIDALVGAKVAVIEAGTGTGKTLAYLVPAILSGLKVVVATATKALQEQIVDQDLPLLERLGLKFSAAVMKGRQNYLCLLKFEQFEQSPVFVSRDEKADFERLRSWAHATSTGDRAELDLPDGYVAWRDVSSTAETCVGQECPHFSACHVTRMRQRAQEAQVVVVNHHLFFADLALRQSPAAKVGAEVVPRAEAVVFDEAHNIEEVATEFFGAQVSNYRFFDLCRDIDRTAAVRPAWRSKPVGRLTSAVGRAAEAYFGEVAALAPADAGPWGWPRPAAQRPGGSGTGHRGRSRGAVATPKTDRTDRSDRTDQSALPFASGRAAAGAGTPEGAVDGAAILEPAELALSTERRDARWSLDRGALSPLASARDDLSGAVGELRRALVDLGGDKPEPEIEAFARRADDLRLVLEAVSEQQAPDLVYWAETRGRGVFLRASPVDVAPDLQAALFSDGRPIVLTSATLATGGSTAFFQHRVGLWPDGDERGRGEQTVLPSPFDYDRQAALYFPRHLPEPAHEAFLDQATEEIAALIALAEGRTFALFTSLRAMREVHRRLKFRLPYQVLLQGERPKGALVRAFRDEPSVLFATQSFWEGVDVPGDALSLVVIDKLPFASPADPLVAARLESIESRGRSSFLDYSLPSAAISLKQGFGRLIRSRRDTGAVAILDKRLWTKGYGSFLRKSLPSCPTFTAFADLKAWWRETRAHESDEG